MRTTKQAPPTTVNTHVAWPNSGERQLIASLVTKAGTATSEDLRGVKADMLSIPIHALKLIKAHGYRIVVCGDSVTEYLTELRGKQVAGWLPGRTFDDGDAVHDGRRLEIVIAPRKPHYQAYRPRSLAHEIGHALDQILKRPSSHDPSFLRARAQELPSLGDYFRLPDPKGARETYAESFAHFVAGVIEWPVLARYWQKVTDSWQKEAQHGPAK